MALSLPLVHVSQDTFAEYVQPSHGVLMLGCGNSRLSEDRRHGYRLVWVLRGLVCRKKWRYGCCSVFDISASTRM